MENQLQVPWKNMHPSEFSPYTVDWRIYMVHITDHLTNKNQGTESLKGVFYLLYLVVISCFHKITSGTNLRLNLGIKWKGSTQLRSNLIETQTFCTNERSKFILYYLSILRFSKTWNIKIRLASVNEHEKLNQRIKTELKSELFSWLVMKHVKLWINMSV